MSGFTKGPWTARELDRSIAPSLLTDELNCVLIEGISPSLGECDIAYVVQGTSAEDSRDANARLIAAAPALYEALEVAKQALRTCYEVDNFDDSSQQLALDTVSAALAKVTGEENV